MSRLGYYLSSIPTIWTGIKNWYAIPRLLFNRQPIVVELKNGCRFKVRGLMDVWIVKETCLDQDYESHCSDIGKDWTVVDIGAGIGDFAVSVARRHPTCQVYAYEPFPESFTLLEENARLNSVSNVSAFPLAIGPQSGEVTLFASGEAVQHSTSEQAMSESVPALEVQALTLDEAFQSNEIEHCDFLKIDCEGCEFGMLFNTSRETLDKISHICLEYHDGFTKFSHEDLERFLAQRGFQVQTRPNSVHKHLGLLHACRRGKDTQ